MLYIFIFRGSCGKIYPYISLISILYRSLCLILHSILLLGVSIPEHRVDKVVHHQREGSSNYRGDLHVMAVWGWELWWLKKGYPGGSRSIGPLGNILFSILLHWLLFFFFMIKSLYIKIQPLYASVSKTRKVVSQLQYSLTN